MLKEVVQLKKIQEIFTFINAEEFNEIKKQVNKYLKSKKQNYEILYYIAFNNYLLKELSGLEDINTNSNDKEYIKGVRYNFSLYIKKLIALCWYLSNGKDYIHKYQIQMLYENFNIVNENDNIDKGRKFYIKALELNRSVGDNNKNYIPFLDIVKFGNDNYENKANDEENDIVNDLIDEMIYFIPYYQVYKSKGKKKNKEWLMANHPIINLIEESYALWNKHNTELMSDEEW